MKPRTLKREWLLLTGRFSVEEDGWIFNSPLRDSLMGVGDTPQEALGAFCNILDDVQEVENQRAAGTGKGFAAGIGWEKLFDE